MKHLFYLLLLCVVTACSTSRNTATTRWWQSFVTRYNVYYNASKAYREGEATQREGLKDDYTQLLPVFGVSYQQQQNLGKGNFETAITKCEKAIQLHSIKKRPEITPGRNTSPQTRAYLSRKEFNPFLKNAWMLMGKSQFQQGDFLAAASTFAYIARFYAPEPLVAIEAQLWLVRAQVQLGWLYDAEDVLRQSEKMVLPSRLQRERDLTLAHFQLAQKQYALALPYLNQAARAASHHFDKARLYYLLAQVNMLLQKKQDAYRALERCIAQNPPYAMAFQARILQTEALTNRQNSHTMLHKLQRMTKDPNNADYLDQIYYAQGNIYLAQNDTASAIKCYETGRFRATQATPSKGILLRTLAELYWQQQRFDKAQPCYTEAIGLLDKSQPGYAEILRRSAILDHLVPSTQIIFEQDSLLQLASMPEPQRNAVIDAKITQYKKEVAEAKKAKADSALRAAREAAGESLPEAPQLPTPSRSSAARSGGWYFYNTQAVQQGKQTFAKQWGRRKNEDDWRRANHTVVADAQNKGFDYAADDSINVLLRQRRDSLTLAGVAKRDIDAQLRDYAQQLVEGQTGVSSDTTSSADKSVAENQDPAQRAYYLAQLPFTAAAQQAARSKIHDALIEAGLVEKDELEDFSLARRTLQRFVREAPQHSRAAEAYYHLFLIAQRTQQHAESQKWKNLLVHSFPNYPMTRVISDPNFEDNLHFGREREDSLYTAAYAAYLAGKKAEVAQLVARSTQQYPTGANRPKFLLLHSLSRLQDAPRDTLQRELTDIAKDYPKSDVAEFAGMIARGLQEGRTVGKSYRPTDLWTRRLNDAKIDAATSGASTQLSNDRNVPFVFLVAFPTDSLDNNKVLFALAQFNISKFTSRNFDIQQERNNGLTQFRVQGFRSFKDVHYYAQQLYANPQLHALFRMARTELISVANLRLLGSVVSFEEYRNFYNTHFAPLKIKPYLPLEFETEDAPKQIYEDELPQKQTQNQSQSKEKSQQQTEDNEYEYEE